MNKRSRVYLKKLPITKIVSQIDNDSSRVETKLCNLTVEAIRVYKPMSECVNDLLNNDYRIIKNYDGYQIIKGYKK